MQSRNLFPDLTVRQNVEIGGYLIKDEALLRRRLDAVVTSSRSSVSAPASGPASFRAASSGWWSWPGR